MAYEPKQIEACRVVLLELMELLAPWEGHTLVVGGYAVQLTLSARGRRVGSDYVGTMDVDLMGDLPSVAARRLRRTLLDAGYTEHGQMTDRLIRTVDVGGKPYDVPVDLMLGVSSEHRRYLEGAVAQDLRWRLPSGTPTKARVLIASLPDLLLMKMRAYADENAKGKDGYDVYQLIRHGADSPEALARRVAEALPDELLTELVGDLELFFLQKKRATRDAAMVMRDYHNQLKTEALRDVQQIVTRFVASLRRATEKG